MFVLFLFNALMHYWEVYRYRRAAFASLVTQICTSIVLPLFIKGLRKNSILMLQAITLQGFLGGYFLGRKVFW